MSDATDLQIANSALVKLGLEPLPSTVVALSDTANSKKHSLLQYQFSVIRDLLLSIHSWNFCIRRGYLIRDEVTFPVYNYRYRYPLLSEIVTIYRIADNEHIQWSVEDGYLLTDEGGSGVDTNSDGTIDENRLFLTYNFKNTESDSYPMIFREALAWAIAGDLSYALLQNPQLSSGIMDKADSMLARARTFDAKEGKFNRFTPDLLTRVRRESSPDYMSTTYKDL